MNTFTMKTYIDSYLYNNKITQNAPSNPGTQNDSAISSFIIKSKRIEKDADSFRGVIEDIKRQQTSSVLLSVLMNDNVVLCIGDAPLPRAFTVFGAKDPKNGGKYKVYVDVTGKIEFKDGYYVAKRNEIDKLCALLIDALVYLMYRFYPHKLVNNSNFIMSSATCYVSMFNYILDYLRIIGYSENKKKISYVVALYYLNGMIGADLTDYTRGIAANIAGIKPNEAKAYDLYVEDDGIFTNIGTFIPALANMFRLKGLDLATFVFRWSRSFGVGTEYATELLTSFICMVLNAYTGCYIVQQRQIEMACGSNNIVKLANTFLKSGADSLGSNKFLRESMNFQSSNTKEMSEIMNLKNSLRESDLLVKNFGNKDAAVNEAEEIVSICKKARIEDKIGIYAENSIAVGIGAAYNQCINTLKNNTAESLYENGSLKEVAKVFKNKFTDKQRYNIESTIDRDINQLSEIVREAGAPKEVNSLISKTILEFREIKQYI